MGSQPAIASIVCGGAWIKPYSDAQERARECERGEKRRGGEGVKY